MYLSLEGSVIKIKLMEQLRWMEGKGEGAKSAIPEQGRDPQSLSIAEITRWHNTASGGERQEETSLVMAKFAVVLFDAFSLFDLGMRCSSCRPIG